MSAFYSFVYPDRVCILSDGGAWDEGGNLIGITRKVIVSPNLPFAVVPQGRPYEKLMAIILEMDAFIERKANRLERDGVMASLSPIEDYFEQLGKREGETEAQFLIAGCTKATGPEHWIVCCHSRYESQGVPAFKLINPGLEIQAGPPVSLTELEMVLKIGHNEVTEPTFPAKHGARFMALARQKVIREPGTGAKYVGIGGFCELTTITATGVTNETLCSWPDQVGRPLDPHLPMILPHGQEVAA